jgi:rhodanese-related sulfurtransferase
MKAWPDSETLREMAVILLAVVVLGLAYNRSSPLGVAFGDAGGSASVKSNAPANLLPLATSDPALHNETITALIVPGDSETPSAAVHRLPVSLPWAEVKPLLAEGKILLLDGRSGAAYEAGHIPGAISLPLPLLADKIGQFSSQYPKTKPLVVYCASTQCPVSHAEAVALSEQYGYLDVRVMPGGYAEWRVAEPSAVPTTGDHP